MTAGQQLASARLDHGWSPEQIAERLQVSVARIAALEDTDTRRLPSRHYVRDLVSEYAREVGLDPEELEKRYLAEADALAATKPVAPAHVPSQFVVETDTGDPLRAPEPPPAPVARPIAREAVPAGAPVPARDRVAPGGSAPQLAASVQNAVPSDAAAGPGDEPGPRQPAQLALRARDEFEGDALASVPLRDDREDTAPLRYARRRGGLRYVVGAGACLIGLAALLYLGGVPVSQLGAASSRYAERLRDRLSRSPAADNGGAPDEPAARSRANGQPRTGPTPPATPEAAPDRQPSTAAPAATSRQSPTGAATAAAPPRVAPTAESAAAAESVAADERAAADEPAADEPAPLHTPDVSGPWYLTSRVEAADYSAFKDMTLVFQLTLEQRGTRIVGEGYKFSENGQPLEEGRRTPIALRGRFEGERLVLSFTERGASRTSGGRIVLHVWDDGSLRGRFSSDAARSSGIVMATRHLPGV